MCPTTAARSPSPRAARRWRSAVLATAPTVDEKANIRVLSGSRHFGKSRVHFCIIDRAEVTKHTAVVRLARKSVQPTHVGNAKNHIHRFSCRRSRSSGGCGRRVSFAGQDQTVGKSTEFGREHLWS